MAEITFKKSINSVRHLIEHLHAENFIEYQYAKRSIAAEDILWDRPAEMEAIRYKSLPRNGGQEFMLPNLIPKSKESKMAWDALNLIAQELLRREKSLPPELAEWVADVLADQWTKRGQKRRPRPAKGASRMAHPDVVFSRRPDLTSTVGS